jgi:SAM-dependent methyltransferase
MTIWASGAAYEPYVGRWSRLVARDFLTWIAVAAGGRWLDMGCGTGALTQTILAVASPHRVVSIDASVGYAGHAAAHSRDERAGFAVGDAQHLPFATASFDAVVSGLVLNFLPEPARGVAEMARVARGGALVAAYVWDYAGRMQVLRHFWDAAVDLDPDARDLDEGLRFPLCQPEPLMRLFRDAGLERVDVRTVDVPTVFRDFDDYWTPFLGGQGPAPGYVVSRTEAQRAALRERLRARLPVAADGSISLVARAWAVRGTVRQASAGPAAR